MPSGGRLFYIEGPGTEVVKQRRAAMQETLPANIQVEAARAKWTEDSGVRGGRGAECHLGAGISTSLMYCTCPSASGTSP